MLIGWDKAVKDLSENDDVIARIIANYPDERMEMKNDTLHTLVRSIVGQQISVKAADAIWNRLDDACNNSITEKNLLQLSNDDMRKTGLSSTKSNYIINIVNANLSELDWENMNDEEAIQYLSSLRQIGRWSAEMILLFTYNRSNIWPLQDIGLLRAISNNYKKKYFPPKSFLNKLYKKFTPYCSVATWYLWRSIDDEPIQY